MLSDFVRLQTDVMRTPLEAMLGSVLARAVRERAPPCAGTRPVITMPGFAAGARTQARLVRFLRECGYDARCFVPGFPSGTDVPSFVEGLQSSLGPLIEKVSAKLSRPVALVGHSAGGIYAREYAARFPRGIERVITLGSPTYDPLRPTQENRALEFLVSRISRTEGFGAMGGGGLRHWPPEYPPMPFVCIYSPIDAAVSVASARHPGESITPARNAYPRENLAIRCSHFGMSHHPLVLLAVADRLAADPRNWQRFDPERYLTGACRGLRRWLFPREAGMQAGGLAAQ